MKLFQSNGLTKRFGGLTAVKDVSFTVERGEIVGIIGPNGAGKTTLFDLINGYFKPTAGEALFKDERISGLKPNQVAKRGVARTFQVVKPLARLSVLDNVLVGAFNTTSSTREARERALEVLDFIGLYDRRNDIAKGLPLAMRKRMEVAKALATDPELLMLDEAVAGLNPTETDKMVELIGQIRKEGVTIMVVEHVMRVIMNISDRIVVIHHGEKIAEGSPTEIADNKLVIDAYLGENYA